MSKTMIQEYARIMREGSARFPTKGAQCNGSCTFYFACQNSRDFEECRGFQMLNGESEKLLKRGLTQHDLEYIETAHTFIQRCIDNGQQEQASIILRDISQLREKAAPQPTQHGEGFLNMLEAAHPSNPTATAEPEPETRATIGFRSMLDATLGHDSTLPQPIHRKIESDTKHTLTFIGYSYRGFVRVELWRRQDGTIITKFPEPPPEPKPAKPITRGCGFAAMLEEAFRSEP